LRFSFPLRRDYSAIFFERRGGNGRLFLAFAAFRRFLGGCERVVSYFLEDV